MAYESAQQLRFKQKLRLAREQLIVCGHNSCPPVVTKDCTVWLEEVEAELASVVFRVRDTKNRDLPEAHVSVDSENLRDQLDGTAVWVDPGPHLFHFESEASGTSDTFQTLRKGERGRVIEVTVKPRQSELRDDASKAEQGVAAVITEAGAPDARPSESEGVDKNADRIPIELQLTGPVPSRSMPGTGTYVAGGIGVLALSSFAYFELKASGDASDLRQTCAPHCAESDVDAVRSKLLAANVSLGIGLAAIGVAGLLWFLQGSASSQPTSSLRFDVVPLPGQRGANVVTTFTAP
jgi:hypothetical protein